jgi:hypothetical protein
MGYRNFVVKWGRLLVAFTLLFQTVNFAYSQNSRPRYSRQQTPQTADQIPVDTIISLRMDGYLSSKNARVGYKFTATVTTPVIVNGVEAIPAGATISGRVTQVVPAKRMNKSGMIALDFDEITLPNGLSTQIVGVLTSDDPETQKQIDDENRMSGGKTKDAAVFVGGSGVLGAILGGVTGGGKGAAVGGAVGAGVGLASVLLSKGEEASVPAGTEFGLRLKQPIPIPNEANTYDPSADKNANPDGAPSRDSTSEAQAQTSKDSGREVELSTRPKVQNPNTSENDGSSLPPNTSANDREAHPPATNDAADAAGTDEELPLSSAEMIRRAQQVLHEEGYYEGAVDGVMTQRFENSLKAYQKEHNLPQSGMLDVETAKSLRLVGATRSTRNQERISLPPARQNPNTPASSPASERPSVERASAPNSSEPQPKLSDSRERANRQAIEPRQTPTIPDAQTQVPTNSAAARLQRQAADLLAEYQKLIGVRLTGTGIELTDKAVYTDDEISLLYAFDSFANSTQLYTRLLSSLQSQPSIRSATLAMAREARKTDKIFTASSTRWVNVLNPRWDAIRQDVLKLMYAFNINTAELDY